MRMFIARGRPGAIPSVAAGVAACLVLSACSIPFRSADPEPDTGAGVSSVEPRAEDGTPTPDGTEPGGASSPAEDTGGADVPGPVPDQGADGPDEPLGEPTDGDDAAAPPPFYANTLPDFADVTDPDVGALTDIRMGSHDGFDRVVFEFAGESTPGWHVRFVDWVVADPSGEKLEIEGGAVLEVTILGVPYPEEGEGYDGPSRVRIGASRVLTETLFTSIFEGQLQAFVGVGPGEVPFRVYGLSAPSRVVIDVQHGR